MWSVSVNILAWTQVVCPEQYLTMHQSEAELGVKEKAEKQKGIIPRSAKAEKMPEVVNKILNPTTKQSAVC